MKTARFSFRASARWVTDSACDELQKGYDVQATVKRAGGGVSGTLKIQAENDDILQKACRFISSNGLFQKHFTPMT